MTPASPAGDLEHLADQMEQSVGEQTRQTANLARAEREARYAKTRLVPFGDYVVIRLKKNEEKTIAGIVLPAGMSQGTTRFGYVEAVGPGVAAGDTAYTEAAGKTGTLMPSPIRVQPGDEVVFNRFMEVEPDGVDGEKFIVCPAAAVVAKIAREVAVAP